MYSKRKYKWFENKFLFLFSIAHRNSTVALRVVGGEEKGTQWLGAQLGHPVPVGYKYRDLTLQAGESRV
jgi:hypothetical protein